MSETTTRFFAALVPPLEDMGQFTYASEYFPGAFRMLATKHEGGGYQLLKDSEVRELFNIEAEAPLTGILDNAPFLHSPTTAGLADELAAENSAISPDQLSPEYLAAGMDSVWTIGLGAAAGEMTDGLQTGVIGETEIRLMMSNFPFFAAMGTDVGRVLDLWETMPDYGQGHVVAFPTTNSILAYPVKEGCDASDLVKMLGTTGQVARTATPLSPRMFWYRKGELTSIISEVDGQLGLNIPADMPVKRDAEGVPIVENATQGSPIEVPED